MFASINYRINHYKLLFFMIVKITKKLKLSIKWVYRKIKGLFSISPNGVELEITENENHEKNSIDLTIE